MAAGRFARAQALALRQLADKGERATLVVRTDGAPPDASEPWVPGPPTEASTEVDACFFSIDDQRSPGTLQAQGSVQRVLVAGTALAAAPEPNRAHLVRADGTRWEVVGVEAVNPNEDRVLYKLTARRG